MRLIPMALVVLNPLLLNADEVPRTFFPGIVLDEPIPATFETGQPLSLAGSVEDSGITFLRFLFTRVDGAEQEFWDWVVQGRFVRDIVFPHSLDGEYSLRSRPETVRKPSPRKPSPPWGVLKACGSTGGRDP